MWLIIMNVFVWILQMHICSKYTFTLSKRRAFSQVGRAKVRETGVERESWTERVHMSGAEDGELHSISPSALHMCCECWERAREREGEREEHPLLNGNSCASATAAVWHFRWPRFPLYSPLELAQTTMASHQKSRQENQTLLSVAVEIFVQGGKGGTRPLASPPCQPAFYYWKHAHAHTHTHTTVS